MKFGVSASVGLQPAILRHEIKQIPANANKIIFFKLSMNIIYRGYSISSKIFSIYSILVLSINDTVISFFLKNLYKSFLSMPIFFKKDEFLYKSSVLITRRK